MAIPYFLGLRKPELFPQRKQGSNDRIERQVGDRGEKWSDAFKLPRYIRSGRRLA